MPIAPCDPKRMLPSLLFLSALLWLLSAALASPVVACSLDGRPSLLVNGQRVLLNTQPQDGPDWRVWAQFVTARPILHGTVATLAEDPKQVTLPAEAFSHPWRWRFGDGSSAAIGLRVAHHFAHAGHYKVEVDAYIPSLHRWLNFDALLFIVR